MKSNYFSRVFVVLFLWLSCCYWSFSSGRFCILPALLLLGLKIHKVTIWGVRWDVAAPRSLGQRWKPELCGTAALAESQRYVLLLMLTCAHQPYLVTGTIVGGRAKESRADRYTQRWCWNPSSHLSPGRKADEWVSKVSLLNGSKIEISLFGILHMRRGRVLMLLLIGWSDYRWYLGCSCSCCPSSCCCCGCSLTASESCCCCCSCMRCCRLRALLMQRCSRLWLLAPPSAATSCSLAAAGYRK